MSVPVTAVSDGASFDAGASLAAAADVSVDASSSPPPRRHDNGNNDQDNNDQGSDGSPLL